MATKERTEASGSAKRSQGTVTKKKKKQGLLQSVLGGNKKKTAPVKAASAKKVPAAQQRTAPRKRPDDEAFRQASAALRSQKQAAAEEMLASQQNLQEEVFDTAKQNRERTPEEQKRVDMRKKSAKRSKERAVEAKKAANRPAVTYTQPVPFNLNKLLLQLAVVIAVVLAVVIGLSVFFKVERVVVYGNDAYSAWTVQEASGIEGGENLLSFGRTRACGKIITALPYVKNVRIGIKLPDTVNIYIEEFDVSYAVMDAGEGWWLMTSTGKIAEQIDKATSNSYTKVEGVQIVGPVVGEQAVAFEIFEPEATEATGDAGATESTSPQVTVTANDRLQAALLILKTLEDCDIVGEVASVDVSSLYNLELRYGQRYQVKLGTTSDMERKISEMKQAVAQLNDYQTGILDISYTTYTAGPFYTPLT